MLLVHKIEIKANNKQAQYFARACGVARFAYNWALEQWKKQYEEGEKPTEVKLRRDLNAIKETQYPWMLEVTKVAPQQAIKNLGTAFKRFFNKQGKYPCFKKKGLHDSFRADNGPASQGVDAVKMRGKKIQLPKIGWVKLKETLRFKGQIKSVVISRKADRWFAAINVETSELPHVRKNHGTVGVDLGVTTLATLSTGQKIEGPRAHRTLLKKQRRLSQQLSVKKKGSVNFGKAKIRLARLHARIRNIRVDALHKLTTEVVLNFDEIAIEDLNVSGMVRNRKLARSIMDQSFYEFRRQMEYKSQWYEAKIVVVDRFFPSSKRCHNCHAINSSLKLCDRTWQCECGEMHDRDINAATNLEQFLHTVSSTGIDACEEGSSGAVMKVAA